MLCDAQGVKAVIAESFDESHQRALIGVGILPLQFADGQTAHGLGLSGKERFTIRLNGNLVERQQLTVMVSVTACLSSSYY